MKENLKKYGAEFIGAYFLLFVISAMTFYNTTPLGLAFAVGFIIMVMVYATGHISGGHFNPAVTLSAILRGSLPKSEYLPYLIAQLLGGVLAVYSVILIHGAMFDMRTCEFSMFAMFVCEFLFTFLLCYTVLFTATSLRAGKNSYFGLAIGASLLVGIMAAGGTLCYGAYNPAVAIGFVTLGVMGIKCALISIIAEILAAFVAAKVFMAIEYHAEEEI